MLLQFSLPTGYGHYWLRQKTFDSALFLTCGLVTAYVAALNVLNL